MNEYKVGDIIFIKTYSGKISILKITKVNSLLDYFDYKVMTLDTKYEVGWNPKAVQGVHRLATKAEEILYG